MRIGFASAMRAVLLAQDQPIELHAGDVLLREPFELGDVLGTARRLINIKKST